LAFKQQVQDLFDWSRANVYDFHTNKRISHYKTVRSSRVLAGWDSDKCGLDVFRSGGMRRSAERVGHFGETEVLSWPFIKCQHRVDVGEKGPVVAEVRVREEVRVDRGRVQGVQARRAGVTRIVRGASSGWRKADEAAPSRRCNCQEERAKPPAFVELIAPRPHHAAEYTIEVDGAFAAAVNTARIARAPK
jgi:hypothetical protein